MIAWWWKTTTSTTPQRALLIASTILGVLTGNAISDACIPPRVTESTSSPILAPAAMHNLLDPTGREEVQREVGAAWAFGEWERYVRSSAASLPLSTSRVASEDVGEVAATPTALVVTRADSNPAAVSPTPPELAATPAEVAQSVERPTRNGEAAGSSPALSSTYAQLARCGTSCWGDQLSRAEVEALALAVTGHAEWSAFAGRCFTDGRENRGYVGAVGGPNDDGSYDVGLPQMNTVHAAWADMERIRTDAAYALESAYRLFGRQGYAAWRGC